MGATACIVPFSPPTASVSFWRRRLGSYLGWAEEAKKLHARNSDGSYNRSLELLYPLCFPSLRLLVVALGRSSGWQIWACDRHDFF